MTLNLPNWFWWVLALVLVIIICVVAKINLNVGYEGIHLTQGLVK